jgi:hypothetical protein
MLNIRTQKRFPLEGRVVSSDKTIIVPFAMPKPREGPVKRDSWK